MPTINKGSDYFGVLTYTGDGAASKTVVDTNAVSFTPDFVWIKGRSGATDHALYDAVRGTTKDLVSNSTAAETTQSTGLTAFTNGGFTIGNLAKLNTSGATYTAWCWKANGAGSSNTSGSITSTVSVNTTAGFSVVTYTGTGANATVGHGLGVAPAMIITKARNNSTYNWQVGHQGLNAGSSPWNSYVYLNYTDGIRSASTQWQNTAPTSSVFYLGSGVASNTSTGTYVAYCWSEISGYSKFGYYAGNGNADGVFCYTGFRPKLIMIKRYESDGYNWYMWDTSRNTYNVLGEELSPNLADAAATQTDLDVTSNGFKLRTSAARINASGGSYIYVAFASNPFKNSNSF